VTLETVKLKLLLSSLREKMYSQGGIFSITSRILVVDLLSSMGVPTLSEQEADKPELLNPETITGLVVLHSERSVHFYRIFTQLLMDYQDRRNLYRSFYYTYIP